MQCSSVNVNSVIEDVVGEACAPFAVFGRPYGRGVLPSGDVVLALLGTATSILWVMGLNAITYSDWRPIGTLPKLRSPPPTSSW